MNHLKLSIALAVLSCSTFSHALRAEDGRTPWPAANDIVAKVHEPTFPDKTFSVLDYGANADGKTDNTAAFAAAIEACNKAGGGIVNVPPSDQSYVSGSINILSNVNFHVEKGATIKFSADGSKYPLVPTRYEGNDLTNFSPLVTARNADNIALTGEGVLDADDTKAWNHDGKNNNKDLYKMVTDGTPIDKRIFGPDKPLRTAFIEPYKSTNVLIKDITIQNSYWWQFHPLLCTNVIVDHIHAIGPGNRAHTDGIDPEGCENVVIKDSEFLAGDDGMAIKSGRNNDSQREHRASKNIVLINVAFDTNWGVITCGSEESDGIENIYAYNIKAVGDRPKFAIYIKNNTLRGGYVRNINVDNLSGSLQRAVVFASMNYGKETGPNPCEISGVTLSHFDVTTAPMLLQLDALEKNPMGQITVTDSTFKTIAGDDKITNAPKVTYKNVTVNGQPR